ATLVPSRSAWSKPELPPSVSGTRGVAIWPSASACSTASSATAPSPRSKATSSKSISSIPAARRCSTASSRPGDPWGPLDLFLDLRVVEQRHEDHPTDGIADQGRDEKTQQVSVPGYRAVQRRECRVRRP